MAVGVRGDLMAPADDVGHETSATGDVRGTGDTVGAHAKGDTAEEFG